MKSLIVVRQVNRGAKQMSGSLRLGVILILGVLAAGLAVSIIGKLLSLIWPIAIVLGIGLIVFGLINRTAIGGGRRRYLP